MKKVWAKFILIKNHAINLFNEKDLDFNEKLLNFNKNDKIT